MDRFCMWTFMYEHGFLPNTWFYQSVGDFYAQVKNVVTTIKTMIIHWPLHTCLSE